MRFYILFISVLLGSCLKGQHLSLDSSRLQVSAGTNALLYLGNEDLKYNSQPGFYFDVLYQDYIGKRDSVNENSIMEVGLRYNYFHGEYGSKSDMQREAYSRSQVDIVMGAGARVFRRDCSEGILMLGVSAGIKIVDEEIDFAPTLYLKGGINYFNPSKTRSHGPYLLLIMQDAFFLNDVSHADYWVMLSANVCYSYRF